MLNSDQVCCMCILYVSTNVEIAAEIFKFWSYEKVKNCYHVIPK